MPEVVSETGHVDETGIPMMSSVRGYQKWGGGVDWEAAGASGRWWSRRYRLHCSDRRRVGQVADRRTRDAGAYGHPALSVSTWMCLAWRGAYSLDMKLDLESTRLNCVDMGFADRNCREWVRGSIGLPISGFLRPHGRPRKNSGLPTHACLSFPPMRSSAHRATLSPKPPIRSRSAARHQSYQLLPAALEVASSRYPISAPHVF